MPKEGATGARLTNRGCELSFVWEADRFAHRVRDSLKSIEHPDFETPIFQEVHQQGDLVFASGMAGDRHWSMSVEPCDDGFLFDIACRCKTPAAVIGSAYEKSGESGLHVIGKAIDDAAPPELTTIDATIAIVTRPTVEPPATHRYRYAIVGRGTH